MITDLQNFTEEEIGMLSVVIVGNSKTVRSGKTYNLKGISGKI